MPEVQTNAEMNAAIVGILRTGGRQPSLYAAQRIVELEREVRIKVAVIDEQHDAMTDKDTEIDRLVAVVDPLKAKVAGLQAANKLLHDATIVLRNGMGGHNHWDRTMKHGAGCEVCISQRQAKDEATKLIEQAAKAKEA